MTGILPTAVGSKFVVELQVAKDKFASRSIVQPNDGCARNEIGLSGNNYLPVTTIIAGYLTDCCDACVEGVVCAFAVHSRCIEDLEGAARQACGCRTLSGLSVETAIHGDGVGTSGKRERRSCCQCCKILHSLSFVRSSNVARVATWANENQAPVEFQNPAGGNRHAISCCVERGQAFLHMVTPIVTSLVRTWRAVAMAAVCPFFRGVLA